MLILDLINVSLYLYVSLKYKYKIFNIYILMGKKSKKLRKSKELPFVSVCTPTFNRRPFIPSMINCFNHQTYPKNKIEWIIIDDGDDNIEDLVKNHPNVKYYSYKKKMKLGKKRNIMHEKSKGDIIVYMDDDDYYPPTRIEHAVKMLTSSKCLVAGASEIYIYFKHIQQMWQFGPYGPYHATAGTFAFKKELLQITKYNEEKSLAEEKEFLKSYSIPMIQLDPKQTILVFSHTQNTFDKKKLLEGGPTPVSKVSEKTVDEFVKEPELKKWFLDDIDETLETYEPGKPEKKPDVLKQMIEIEEERRRMMEENSKMMAGKGGPEFIMQQPGQPPQKISPEQITQIIKQQQEQISLLSNELQCKTNKLENKIKELSTLNIKYKELEKTIGSWTVKLPGGKQKSLNGEEIANIMKQLQETNVKLKNKKT